MQPFSRSLPYVYVRTKDSAQIIFCQKRQNAVSGKSRTGLCRRAFRHGGAKMSREELEKYIYAYGKDLFSFCCLVTGSRQEAEDLYQDTFLKMYEVREGLSVEKNPKSFLMGVSVNL